MLCERKTRTKKLWPSNVDCIGPPFKMDCILYRKLVVRRFLSEVCRRWLEASTYPSAKWPNRCLECEKPLLCPVTKYTHCVSCDRLQAEGICIRCTEILETPTKHKCSVCDCLFPSGTCTCPESFYEEEPYISCGSCGANCYGSDMERWRICSRRCL